MIFIYIYILIFAPLMAQSSYNPSNVLSEKGPKGSEILEIKISEVKKSGIPITCRIWSWIVEANICREEVKTVFE